MSAASKPQGRPMTVAEFLAYDDGTDTRYELVNGALVAMNPPAVRHAILCHNIGRALDRQLRPPCVALWSAVGVAVGEANDTWRQPDVVVTCTPTEGGFVAAPRVVVEVLSPSTEKDDRTTKLDFYESVPSMEAVLLVWQEERRVRPRERGEDGGWRDHDVIGSGTVELGGLGARLTLDEIYHDPWAAVGEAETG